MRSYQQLILKVAMTGLQYLKNADAPRNATLRVPSRVLNVWMPYLRSPSTSARSFVMAITVANSVTKHVMNLRTLSSSRVAQSLHACNT